MRLLLEEGARKKEKRTNIYCYFNLIRPSGSHDQV